MWDSQLNLPVPPVNAAAPVGFALGCTIFYGVLAGLVALYGVKHWRETKRPILLLLVLSGGLTVVAEPLVDLLGACWHPRFGQDVVFELFGRPIPPWMLSAYFAFFGGLGPLNYLAFSRGVSTRAIRLWFLAPMLFDVIIEEVMLNQKLYIYYGAQPLILVGKLPLWWVPCNSTGEFIGVVFAVMAAPILRGWKTAFLLLVFPLGDLAGYALVGFPAMAAINGQVPFWVEQSAGILTFLLAFLVVHCISLLLAGDSPLRLTAPALAVSRLSPRAKIELRT